MSDIESHNFVFFIRQLVVLVPGGFSFSFSQLKLLGFSFSFLSFIFYFSFSLLYYKMTNWMTVTVQTGNNQKKEMYTELCWPFHWYTD